MLERLLVRKTACSNLHPNAEDEFSMDSVGPSYRIVSEYEAKFRESMHFDKRPIEEPLTVEKLRHYGIKFDGIVNGTRHQKEVQQGRSQILPQKVPNRYKISLHVDDEAVICSYGREFGFEAYQLDAQDDEWKEKIIAKAEEIKKKWDKKHQH